MLFVRLFALALLFHENTGLFTRGRSYFTTCFLPTFGLRLSPRGMIALHGSLIVLCAALLVWPSLWPLYPLLLLALSLLIASYSLRLSNHLVAAWFMGLLLCLDLLFQTPARRGLAPTPFFLSGVQIVVVLTYLLAFLHKLNPEYLSPRMSCGSYLGCEYLERRVNIRHPALLKIQGFLSIYAILALEAVVPILLLFPQTRALGLVLAVLLHLPLGFLVHVHFSTLMYAGLSVFVSPQDWPRVLAATFALSRARLALYVLLGLYLGHRFGGYGYARRLPAYLHQLLFGVYFLAVFAVSLTLLHRGPLPATFAWGSPFQRVLLLTLTLAYLVNGLGPYLGLKTNFSFAMFSNLRPIPWSHLLWRAKWRPLHLARYVRIETIHGLPEAVEGVMPQLVLERLREPDRWQYTDYFFHEGLGLLCRTAKPTPVIRLVYTEDGRRHETLDYAREAAANPPRPLRLGLFPYALPLDPEVRHCD